MMTILKPLMLLGALITCASLPAQDAGQVPPPAAPRSTTPDAAPPLPAAGDPLFAPVATPASETLHDKFIDYAIVTVGPRALFTPVFSAAIRMARPPKGYPREWRDGAGAFGLNYADHLARSTAMQTGRFITGAVLHEDFRYRPSTSKDPLARIFHAVGYAFVDKTDSGHAMPAMANFVGAACQGFVGNLYLPSGYDNLSHAETRMANAFAGFALRNITREFAPDIFKATRKVHLPFPRIPIPDWWVSR